MEQVTEQMISEWKAKYGRVKKITLDDTEFYYRGISLTEYNNVQQAIADPKIHGEEVIMRTGTLYPKLPAQVGAGVILKLSDEILIMSGFDQGAVAEEV